MNTRSRFLGLAALALALAAGVWFASRTGGIEDAAPQTVGGPGVAARAPLEGSQVAAAADPEPDRTELVPSASPTTSDSGALLSIACVARETRAALARVRVYLSPLGVDGFEHQSVESNRGEPGQSLISDATGRVEFSVSSGVSYRLSAHAESEPGGHAAVEIPALASGEKRELRVELPTVPDLRFYGRVVRAEDGSPIAGARIELLDGGFLVDELEDTRRSSSRGAATTDAEGYFELATATWKHPHLRISVAGFGPALIDVTQGHASRETAFVVRLDRGATLEVHVRNLPAMQGPMPQVRAVVEGYRIAQTDSGSYAFVAGDEIRRTDLDGSAHATVEDLPARVPIALSLMLGSKPLWQGGAPLELAPGETRELEIALGSGATIRGVAVDPEDHPVAGAGIWLVRNEVDRNDYFAYWEDPTQRTRTDARGEFQFTEVAPGRWAIGFAPSQAPTVSSPAPQAEIVIVEPTTATVDVRLVAWRGLFLAGKVIDLAEQPVERESVTANGVDVFAFVSGLTESDGSFSIGPLAPGAFDLRAGGPGGRHTSPRAVRAQAGDTGIVLRVERGCGLSGRVVAPDGTGSGAQLVFAALDGADDDLDWMLSSTKPDGTFAVDGLQPGGWRVTASSSERAVSREMVLRAGETITDLELVLGEAARLKARYDGPHESVSLQVKLGGAIVSYSELKRGLAVTVAVPAGSLVVEVWRPDEEGSRETKDVQVLSGEQRELSFGR